MWVSNNYCTHIKKYWALVKFNGNIDFSLFQTISLCGVELKDAVAGWRANLIQDITSSVGFYSSDQEGMFSKWLESSYTQPVICNIITMLVGFKCAAHLAFFVFYTVVLSSSIKPLLVFYSSAIYWKTSWFIVWNETAFITLQSLLDLQRRIQVLNFASCRELHAYTVQSLASFCFNHGQMK